MLYKVKPLLPVMFSTENPKAKALWVFGLFPSFHYVPHEGSLICDEHEFDFP